MPRQRCLKTLLVLLSLLPACGRDVWLPGSGDAPTVTAVLPANVATGVALDASISATFDKDMDGTTLDPTTFRVTEGATNVSGIVTYSGPSRTAFFSPTAVLGTSLVYTATITTGAKSAGVGIATNYVWYFTAAPTGPPEVIGTTPSNGAVNVAVGRKPTATFKEAMDLSTVTPATFLVMQGVTPISGTVAFNATSHTATFAPAAFLTTNLVYTATITTGARDAWHTAMVAPHVWNFTTGACSQAPVVLGSAGNFAVLAFTTVSNTASTTVTGDLGAGTSVANGVSLTVNGTRHVADATAAKALADLAVAYDDAAARTLCMQTLPAALGGLTRMPGLYRSIGAVAITGDLTLDAQGDSDAVFLFQIQGALTPSDSSRVLLTNGARASNVYWQVLGAATLAANTVFKGTILAHDVTSLGVNATLVEGRAMSVTADVTLDTNTVAIPAP